MVPASLFYAKLPGVNRTQPGCVYLYCYLDLHQGKDGFPARNITTIAEVLGVQTRTVKGWLESLEAAGLVEVVRKGTKAAVVRVLHNPARDGLEVHRCRRSTARSRRRQGRVVPIVVAGARTGSTREERAKSMTPPRAKNARHLARRTRERTTQCRAKNARHPRSLKV